MLKNKFLNINLNKILACKCQSRLSGNHQKSFYQQKAFTLIELIMVIVIIGVIAGMVAPFISATLGAWLSDKNERELVFSARVAMHRMMREIMQASTVNSANNTNFNFVDINNNSISFYRDAATHTLLRNNDILVASDKDPVLQFTCLDRFMGNATTVADITMVRIRITLSSASNTITLQSLVPLVSLSHAGDGRVAFPYIYCCP